MGVLTHAIAQSCQIIEYEVDFHGDQVETSRRDTLCRFRYITQLNRSDYKESIDNIDALAWFEPTEDVSEGSILFVDNAYWRVDQLIKARRLVGSNVMFLKAFLRRHSQVTGDMS